MKRSSLSSISEGIVLARSGGSGEGEGGAFLLADIHQGEGERKFSRIFEWRTLRKKGIGGFLLERRMMSWKAEQAYRTRARILVTHGRISNTKSYKSKQNIVQLRKE